MEITELVFMSVIVLLAEALIFIGFERRAEKSWGDGNDIKDTESSEPSGDGRFWQNIISYDHRKGGDKE